MPEPLPTWDTHDVEDLKRFARIRLIAADLDGTLIPADLLKTVQMLCASLNHHRYRVTFTLATGRTLSGVEMLLTKLAIPNGIPLILYNGSVVIRSGDYKLLSRKTIPRQSLEAVIRLTLKYGLPVLAYFYDDPWFARHHLRSSEYVFGWGSPLEGFREFNNMPVTWHESDSHSRGSEPSSLLIETREFSNVVSQLEAELRKVAHVSVTRSGSKYIEVRPHESNKAFALEFVARKYGIHREEILALGDNDNDAEMLGWAGIGVAIAAASPGAIKESDYICRHGVFQGAVEVLRLVKHAKHYFYRPPKTRKDLEQNEPNGKLVKTT